MFQVNWFSLGGGNSNIFGNFHPYLNWGKFPFHPENWGRISPILTDSYFSKGLVQPPTRCLSGYCAFRQDTVLCGSAISMLSKASQLRPEEYPKLTGFFSAPAGLHHHYGEDGKLIILQMISYYCPLLIHW